MRKSKCAILGLGNQAREHIQAAIQHPDIEIIAGIDTDSRKWAEISAAYPQVPMRFFASIEEFISADLAIDGLILALPHHVYETIWTEILSCGVPLLKEKPLARNLLEARFLMQQAQAANCSIMTAIQRRYHPSYQFLQRYLQEQRIVPTEIHAHLHLGKDNSATNSQHQGQWRAEKELSGGGIFLDAGYHMVDLLLFAIGQFEVLSSTMWLQEKIHSGDENEDHAWIYGRTNHAWLMLDIWLKGNTKSDKQGFQKSEGIILRCPQGEIKANRAGVWLNEESLLACDADWNQAMRAQLSHFHQFISTNDWQENSIWAQLSAVSIIDDAYHLSIQY